MPNDEIRPLLAGDEDWGDEGLADDELALLFVGALGSDQPSVAARWIEPGERELRAAGSSAIGRAAQWNAARCVDMLLTRGCDWAEPDAMGKTSLELAAAAGAAMAVERILSWREAAGARPGDLIVIGAALATALERGHGACVEALLPAFPQEHRGGWLAGRAMAMAIDGGVKSSVDALLAHGWSPNMLVSARSRMDADGVPAIIHASEVGAWGAVESLVKAGADPKGLGRAGASMLMLAARGGALESVRLLLEAGVDVDARDHQGHTALMHVAKMCGSKGGEDVLRLILRAGADPALVSHAKVSALEMLATRWDVAPLKILCEWADPRPMLAKIAAGKALLSCREEAVAVMEECSAIWIAREQAANERGEIAQSLSNGQLASAMGAGRL